MLKKITSNYDKVKWFLENMPFTRDSDLKLIAKWWWNEARKQGLYQEDFLEDFADGKYTTPEAITRARRKVQEMHPELRGKAYKPRKIKEQEIRQKI